MTNRSEVYNAILDNSALRANLNLANTYSCLYYLRKLEAAKKAVVYQLDGKGKYHWTGRRWTEHTFA
jgi:hypothetical protein